MITGFLLFGYGAALAYRKINETVTAVKSPLRLPASIWKPIGKWEENGGIEVAQIECSYWKTKQSQSYLLSAPSTRADLGAVTGTTTPLKFAEVRISRIPSPLSTDTCGLLTISQDLFKAVSMATTILQSENSLFVAWVKEWQHKPLTHKLSTHWYTFTTLTPHPTPSPVSGCKSCLNVCAYVLRCVCSCSHTVLRYKRSLRAVSSLLSTLMLCCNLSSFKSLPGVNAGAFSCRCSPVVLTVTVLMCCTVTLSALKGAL